MSLRLSSYESYNTSKIEDKIHFLMKKYSEDWLEKCKDTPYNNNDFIMVRNRREWIKKINNKGYIENNDYYYDEKYDVLEHYIRKSELKILKEINIDDLKKNVITVEEFNHFVTSRSHEYDDYELSLCFVEVRNNGKLRF